MEGTEEAFVDSQARAVQSALEGLDQNTQVSLQLISRQNAMLKQTAMLCFNPDSGGAAEKCLSGARTPRYLPV